MLINCTLNIYKYNKAKLLYPKCPLKVYHATKRMYCTATKKELVHDTLTFNQRTIILTYFFNKI